MKIKPEIVKDIAEMLDMGMVCFYHKATGEFEYYPDELRAPIYDEEVWAEVMDKVEENYTDYIRIEGMHSSEAFRVMEDFVNGIDEVNIRERFMDAISYKKPFSNFNDLVRVYPQIQKQWFVYKLDRYVDFVREQMEAVD